MDDRGAPEPVPAAGLPEVEPEPAPERGRAPRSRRRIAVAIAAALVVLIASGSAFGVAASRRTEPPPEEWPILAAAKPEPTTTTLPPTTLPPLPVPADSPADPYEDVPVVQIGEIEIPKVGLRHAVYEGVWLTVIDEGPGHWPGTAMPGQLGNTVFPGHRTTHSRPFFDLDLLAPGDQIRFHMPDGVHTYAVRETLIVAPEDTWVVNQDHRREATLIACHPKGSARQRIVVKADWVLTEPAPTVPPA